MTAEVVTPEIMKPQAALSDPAITIAEAEIISPISSILDPTAPSFQPVLTAVVTMEPLKNPALNLNDADDESSSGNHSEGPTFSDSDPKDSGVDSAGSSAPDYVSPDIPDDETAGMIMRSVEFYLSDENILRDPFLLKHVRRSKEGFVSLKLLASFRRVRCLSRNWKAVAHSVAASPLLALNADGTKVRRLAPLPDYDETVTSRSVIVHGFAGEERPSVDSVSEMFAGCGDIALVRILRPGGSVPADVKKFLAKNPEVQCKVCALVEFEEHAYARKALEGVYPDPVNVIPVLIKDKVVPDSPKKTPSSPTTSPKKKKKNRKSSKNADEIQIPNQQDVEGKRTRRCSSGSMSSSSSGYLSSSPYGGHLFDPQYPRRHSFNPSIYNDPNSSFASLSSRYQGSKDRLNKVGASSENQGVLSPWRRRREQSMQSDSNLLSSVSTTPQSAHPVKMVRSPRGPDGTNGFGPRTTRLSSMAE